jgi:hypothetical protein
MVLLDMFASVVSVGDGDPSGFRGGGGMRAHWLWFPMGLSSLLMLVALVPPVSVFVSAFFHLWFIVARGKFVSHFFRICPFIASDTNLLFVALVPSVSAFVSVMVPLWCIVVSGPLVSHTFPYRLSLWII